VFTGSFCAARRSASLATANGTPVTSNITLPGFTTAAQYSTAPLPLPIRTSAGFLVIGLSGKILIHTWPSRFIARVTAIRAASICLLVIQLASNDFMANDPNEIVLPLPARPFTRPFCIFLYFVLFGCNISIYFKIYLIYCLRLRLGPPSFLFLPLDELSLEEGELV